MFSGMSDSDVVKIDTGGVELATLPVSLAKRNRDRFESGEWKLVKPSMSAVQKAADLGAVSVPSPSPAPALFLSKPIVCHVIPWPMDTAQGPHTFINSLALSLIDYEHHAIYKAGDSEYEKKLFNKSVSLHPVKSETEAQALVTSLSPALLHVHAPYNTWAIRESKTPKVGTYHVTTDNPQSWAHPICGDHANVIRLGVDCEFFKPIEKKAHDRFIIGVVGGIYARKVPGTFVDFLKRGIPEGVELVFIGSDKIDTTAEKLRNIPGVTVRPECDRERLVREYQSFDALLIPSSYEGTPWSALEAMACGVPVIGRNVGGVADVLGNAGRLFSQDAEIWPIVQNMRVDRDRYLDLCGKARLRALREFNHKAMLEQYGTAYDIATMQDAAAAVVISHGPKQADSVRMTLGGIRGAVKIIGVDSDNSELIPGGIKYRDSKYQGKPKSMNMGIDAALRTGAEFIYVSMNDVVLPPNGLNKLVDYMRAHPKCGIATPLFYTNEVGLNIDGQWPNMPSGPVAHFEVLSFIIRREVAKKIRLDESLVSTWGCCLQYPAEIWEAGWEVHKAAGIRADHLGATTNGIVTGERNAYYKQGMGEIWTYLNRRLKGDFFAALEWITKYKEVCRKGGCSEETITRLDFLFGFHGQFMIHRTDLPYPWRGRGKPVMLFYTYSANIGGVEYIFANMADEFRRMGYDTLYLYWDHERLPVGVLKSIPVLRLSRESQPYGNGIYPGKISSLTAFYDALKPAAIMSYFVREPVMAGYHSEHKPKYIEWADGMTGLEASLPTAIKSNTLPDAFFSESIGGKEYIESQCEAPVFYTGSPVKMHKANGCKTLFDPKKKKVLRVSRLTPGKGAKLFCDTLKELGDDYQGIWVGPQDKFTGCNAEYIHKYESAKPDNVSFIGAIEDQEVVNEYIRQADYFLSTSNNVNEGVSVAVTQAMIHGKPIFVVESGYLTRLLGNGAGVVVPKNVTGKEFADAIFNTTDAELKRMGAAAKKRSENHSIGHACGIIDDFIKGKNSVKQVEQAREDLRIVAFGFKYGIPRVNNFIDVSFLKNPSRSIGDLETDTDDRHVRFVKSQPQAQALINELESLAVFLIAQKDRPRLGIGCSAGRHRSSIVAHWLAERLRVKGFVINVICEDIT